jgi:alpha-L-rhamnosidase
VREQSWDGSWFHDYAVRDKNGRLVLRPDRTEVCQYYAFFFGVASFESHSALWRTLVSDFGPRRREGNRHPDIWPANAFIGNYLRLELLSRAGCKRQALEEAVGYFSKMADRTGTLWEHDDTRASCCHGFASHLAVVCVRDALGLTINPVEKKVRFVPPENGLTCCSGEFPVPDGIVKASWSLQDGRLTTSLDIPEGWSALDSTKDACEEKWSNQ